MKQRWAGLFTKNGEGRNFDFELTLHMHTIDTVHVYIYVCVYSVQYTCSFKKCIKFKRYKNFPNQKMSKLTKSLMKLDFHEKACLYEHKEYLIQLDGLTLSLPSSGAYPIARSSL